MYVDAGQWSVPDQGDPLPCFRQGDLVELTWARPQMSYRDNGTTVRLENLEVRTEIVALLGACCDLVNRAPPKRKGVLVSPLREVPKSYTKSPDLMSALRATAAEAVEKKLRIPANLFFYAALTGTGFEQGGVIYLESIASVPWDAAKTAKKLAELTPDARSELSERIKHHFTRTED